MQVNLTILCAADQHKTRPLANLATDIPELGDSEGAVEGEFYHVVPPDAGLDLVLRVTQPAVLGIPGPGEVPHHHQAQDVNCKVEQPPPPRLAELV